MAKQSYPIAFVVGDGPEAHVSKEKLDEYLSDVTYWISIARTSETDPRGKAEAIIKSALHGEKLNGEFWKGVEVMSLESRIKQLSGYDVIKKRGKDGALTKKNLRGMGPGQPKAEKAKATKAANTAVLDASDQTSLYIQREDYKKKLYEQFPHLSNPVYDIKVNTLAESEVKLASLSDSFMSIKPGAEMERLQKIQAELRKSINELSDMLSISPKYLLGKMDDTEKGDVGSLITAWEKHGEVSKEYEIVDAIQELIQTIRQLHNLRTDGSPQLADWLLFHKTGCRGHQFTCECNRVYEIFDGFTKEELEAAAEQAYKVYGFGLKRRETEHGSWLQKESTPVQDAPVSGDEAIS